MSDMTEVKNRPILFSGEMVRALLDGRKTQTRRIVKNTGLYAIDANIHGKEIVARELKALATQSPYGQPGDLLWVRESAFPHSASGEWLYKADLAELRELHARLGFFDPAEFKWLPSIHMPKEASRLTLRITSVRVERLQEINESDAWAEGIERLHDFGNNFNHASWRAGDASFNYPTAIDAYQGLWDHINGDGAWTKNPWVWVVEFEVIHKNISELIRNGH